MNSGLYDGVCVIELLFRLWHNCGGKLSNHPKSIRGAYVFKCVLFELSNDEYCDLLHAVQESNKVTNHYYSGLYDLCLAVRPIILKEDK